MATSLNNLLTFDRGLSDITEYRAGEAAATLPAQSKVLPSQQPITEELRDVINDRSIEQNLLEALMPHVSDSSVMLPQNFNALLNEVKEDATSLAASSTDRNSRHHLEALADLMTEEASLNNLLSEARSQLLQA